jgi:hypothetical protein
MLTYSQCNSVTYMQNENEEEIIQLAYWIPQSNSSSSTVSASTRHHLYSIVRPTHTWPAAEKERCDDVLVARIPSSVCPT